MASDPGLPLRVGMGIDVGEVIPIQGGYRGRALNLAARLCSLAGPGEVFSSEEVVQQAQRIEGLAYVERGHVQLKGFEDPIRVIHVLPQVDLPEHFPPLVSLIAKPSNLPVQTTPFIGREQEVGKVADLLRREQVRLVTLTGPGGTGKTRLALQVGGAVLDDFERGVFFVNLAPLADPDLVASTIADTLKVKEVPSQDILRTLIEYLQDRQLLLVLDNFEHLLPAATVVHQLLVACSRLTVLVTSRAILHLSGEHECLVPPLAVPDPNHLPDLDHLSHYDAVALFIERARTVKPTFAISNGNAPAVAGICYRLDGLPLAIELAAARIKLFPPQALLGRLSSRLKLLTGGARDLPSRQQTLRGTIDWSYSLLNQDERRLFARLSVFVGGCTIEAAEEVGNPEDDLETDVLDGMASLVDKSLLQEEGQEEPRFAMLETIREYAAERLDESGEAERLKQAHASHYLALAEKATEWRHTQGAMALRRLEEEHDNLRAALRWLFDRGRTELAVRLAGQLGWFWFLHGHPTEGQRWLDEALARGSDVPPSTRVHAVIWSGQLAWFQGDHERCIPLAEESVVMCRELGDKRWLAATLKDLGNMLAQYRGEYERAESLLEESVSAYKEASSTGADAQHGLAYIALYQKQYERAEELAEQSLEAFRKDGFSEGVTGCLGLLGRIALEQGECERAEELYRECLVLSRSLGFTGSDAECLDGLAAVAGARGQSERSARLAAAAEVLRVSTGIAPPPIERSYLERDQARARALLDETAWTKAWEAGRAMSLGEAVAYALGERLNAGS
jgi:predicted ATPase